MVQNSMTNDATQLRISILEKQIQQQNQTSKEILNQLKNKKDQKTHIITIHLTSNTPPSHQTILSI